MTVKGVQVSDNRVSNEIAKEEGTFSKIKTYDPFNIYRLFGLVISWLMESNLCLV